MRGFNQCFPKNIEYNNVNITINGSQENTEIVAKLGNAGIFNETQGKEVVISGGKADGAAVAVSQISTGKTANQGGDVTLLNREGDKLMMDSLYIGTNKTVTIKQGSDKEDLDASSTIQMNAYNINDIKDMSLNYCYGVLTEKGAALNADLILGAGSSTEAVMFATETEHLEYGTTTDEHGYGLNMMDNDLTLTEGIVMYYDYTYNPEGPMEMLLFTNVDSLTLGAIEYDNKYFDFREGIAASTFFSTEQKNTPFCDSFSAPTVDEEGNKKGWFIEYRDDGKGKGTGDVYLAYNTIKAANVPEPTTATLSLLALAGLAARRRRR